MIIGIGTDIVDIPKIEKIYNRYGARFLNRLFTKAEQDYCNSSKPLMIARYAKRFAAKEACLKAVGTGRRDKISWHDIEVTNDDLGKPSINLTGRSLELINLKLADGLEPKIHISLSDSEKIAQAFVIIEAS